MTTKNKYREILDYIRDAILSGKYKAGDRLPTDGQLMRQFQTSRPTAARAMRDLETEGFLERRAGSGSFVRVPALTKNSLIGLLTPELGSAEIFEPICSEIAARCQKHNLSLLWADSSGGHSNDRELEEKLQELCQRYIDLKLSGVFFAPVEFSKRMKIVNREIAERLDEAGISVVLLDRDLDRLPDRSRFDLVSVDNFRVGFLQTEYMFNLGCEKIAYVSRGDSAPTIDLRIFGYRMALQKRNAKYPSSLVFSGNVDDETFVKKMTESKPDAVVCSNDATAAGLLKSLNRLGISVPQTIKIIGVDDVKIANVTSVPLTTIHQPCRELGRAAVATMIRRIENRKMAATSVFVEVELAIRESCGAKLADING